MPSRTTSTSTRRAAAAGSSPRSRAQRPTDWLRDVAARAPALAPLGDADRAALAALREHRDAWVIDGDGERARERLFAAVSALGAPALWLSASPSRVRRVATELEARGVAVTAFESAADTARRAALDKVARGGSRIVLASVAAFAAPALERALARAALGVVAVEDPQLASELAAEVRPAYATLGARVRGLGKLAVHALARVVPSDVALDAAAKLGLTKPVWLAAGAFPAGLTIEAQSGRGEGRLAALVGWVERLQGPGVVLCATPHEVDAAAAALAGAGLSAHRVHAGLPSAERAAELERFAAANTAVLLTTSADAPSSGLPGLCEPSAESFNGWGHGAVRRDLRFLVHFHAPASLEQYARELGWLGRDGGGATAVLLYDSAQRSLNQAILGQQRLQAGHATEIGRAFSALLAAGRTSSVEALAFGSGQSRRATERLVALLVDAGIAERKDGKVSPIGDAAALVAGTDALAARLGRLSLRDPHALEAVERFALGRECKLDALRRAFGVETAPCGRCTACERRAGAQEMPARRSQRR